MRKIIGFILFLIVLSAKAQTTFDGLIEMKLSTNDKPEMGRTKFYFSDLGGRSETEMKFSPNLKPFRTVRLYKKENPNVYYIINDDALSYSVTDLSKYQAVEKPDEKVTVKVIGTEKILGYNSTHVLISTKNGDTEMWTTKELMDYDSYKKINESDVRSRNTSIAKALIEANAEGFPVKTIKRDNKGAAITIELVRAEKKPVSKSFFEIPADYTKTETPTSGMEGMMQEIKQMSGGAMSEDSNSKTEGGTDEQEVKNLVAPKKP